MRKVFSRKFMAQYGLCILFVVIIVGYSSYIIVSTPGLLKKIEAWLHLTPRKTYGDADYDWSLQGLDGSSFRLADGKGKVVFLTFWSTGCSSCFEDIMSIQRLYSAMKDKPVIFLCVSEENAETVRKFVQKEKLTFPAYTLVGKRPHIFDSPKLPTTFVLARDGKIVLRTVGESRWDNKATFDFLKKQL